MTDNELHDIWEKWPPSHCKEEKQMRIAEQLIEMAERLERQWMTPIKDEEELGKTLLQVAAQLREIATADDCKEENQNE
jgi:hypothetical protein